MTQARLLPLVVILLLRISVKSAQHVYPGLIDSNQANGDAKIFLPTNIWKQFMYTQHNDFTTTTSTKCSRQMELLQEGLQNSTLWALKMIDASSKIPSGILTGSQKDLGMYDECVNINEIEDGEEIRGRHCMYGISAELANVNLTETLSVCVPAGCEPNDVQEFLNRLFETITAPIGMKATISGVTCSSVDPPEWTAGSIVALVGLSGLLLFLTVCTICDIFVMYSGEKFQSYNQLLVIREFSFYTNARRILSTKTSPQTLPALQGLRFFSMCWIIYGHEYFMHLFAPTANLTDMFEWASSWQSVFIMVGTLSVDTFFTISGFLMSYLFLKEMSTGRSFNIFAYYIHRYLRLTPAYASLIVIVIFILPRMGSGPIWESTMADEEAVCRRTWWSMLLYVHNYVNKGCMGHTWYLSTEMQYFWISPIILYPLTRKPKIGLAILAAFFVASIVIPAKICYDNKYTSVLFANGHIEETFITLENFYMESHIRAAPWLVGIFFGYLVFTEKGPTKKITKWIGWLLAIFAFAFCIGSRIKFQDKNYVYDVVWETFSIAVARPMWAYGVSWIIYACVRGFGGPVTTILSFSIFHPLSRLSYCVYLLHYVIEMTKARITRVPRIFTTFATFDQFLSDLLLSLIFGFVFSLCFESPVMVLERLVKKRSKRNATDSTKELKNENVENNIDKSGLH